MFNLSINYAASAGIEQSIVTTKAPSLRQTDERFRSLA